jgi:hypothetical protein
MSRRFRLLLIAVLLAQAAAWGLIVHSIQASSRYQTAEPEQLLIYGGIVRRENKATPWHFVAEKTPDGSGHVLVGFTTVTCDWRTGILHVKGKFRAVATAWTQADETFTRRRIAPGPSIGNDDVRVYFHDKDGRRVSCSNPGTWGATANVWVGAAVTR